MADQDTTYDGGAQFALTHRFPTSRTSTVTPPVDLRKRVATARSAAGEKNLEILGADVAAQCLQRGLVDEILYVLPVLLGDGVRFSPPSPRQDRLEPSATPGRRRHDAPLPRATVGAALQQPVRCSPERSPGVIRRFERGRPQRCRRSCGCGRVRGVARQDVGVAGCWRCASAGVRAGGGPGAGVVFVVGIAHHEGAQRPELGLDRVGPRGAGRVKHSFTLWRAAQARMAGGLVGRQPTFTRRIGLSAR